MVDVIDVVRDFLLDDADLAALVGTRLYGGRDQPPQAYEPADGGCVTFRVRGGQADYDDALLRPSVQFKAYGRSAYEAGEVYRALYDRLQNGRGATVLHAECEMMGQQLEEPETGWFFTLTYFKVLVRQS